MLAILWAKVWKWVVGIGVVIVAFGSAYLAGMRKGDAKQQTKVDEANQRAEVAQQQQQITESRHDTDTKVQNLPEAPAQTVANADPSTSAGHLRDDGWVRQDGHGS